MRALIASQLLAAASALNIPRDLSIRQNTDTYTVPLSATNFGLRFNAPVTFGDETFDLLVDTGSSDTFVVQQGYQCVAATSSGDTQPVSQSQCGFPDAKYSINSSDTYERITNESFRASYGAGIAYGLMAYEDISLGGVTVTDQRFGLVNRSSIQQLGASGVLGLAFPVITSAYEQNGTLTADDQNPYNPLFVNMYRRDLVDSYFSLALQRLESDQETGDGGVMVLGGLPDMTIEGEWANVSAEFYEAADLRSANGTRARSYWATTVDSISYGDSEYTQSYQTIVDSGAPMNYVPTEVADGYNALFDTPGQWLESAGGYAVLCSDEVPSFSVNLGGVTFTLNSKDLVVRAGSIAGQDICLSTVTRAQEMPLGEDPTNTTQLSILGAAFLKDVVAVFDFGNSEMRFAQRESAAVVHGVGRGWFVVLGAVVVLLQGLF